MGVFQSNIFQNDIFQGLGQWQSVHLRWTDGSFGVGLSATRAQTTHSRSLTAYNIALGLQRAGRLHVAPMSPR
jgi:hypothetical protein